MSLSRYRNLAILALIAFVDQASLGIILPFATTIFTNPDSSLYLFATQAHLGSQATVLLGLAYAAHPLALFFAAPLLGRLSDTIGRKQVLVASLFVGALAYGVIYLGAVSGLWWLIIAGRLLSGVASGTVAVAFACVADMSDARSMSTNVGIVTGVGGLGLILGPAFGSLALRPGETSVEIMLYCITALSVLGVITWWKLGVPPSVGTAQRESFWYKMLHFSKRKRLVPVYAISFLFHLALGIFSAFSTVHLVEHFGLDQRSLGVFISIAGIYLALSQAVIVRILARFWKTEHMLVCACVLTGLGMVGYGLSRSMVDIYTVLPVVACGVGMGYTAILSIISLRARAHERGEIQGVNTSIQALSQSFAGIGAGVIAASYTAGGSIIIAGIIVAITAAAAWRWLGREQ